MNIFRILKNTPRNGLLRDLCTTCANSLIKDEYLNIFSLKFGKQSRVEPWQLIFGMMEVVECRIYYTIKVSSNF